MNCFISLETQNNRECNLSLIYAKTMKFVVCFVFNSHIVGILKTFTGYPNEQKKVRNDIIDIF